jgi:hypothetical protein
MSISLLTLPNSFLSLNSLPPPPPPPLSLSLSFSLSLSLQYAAADVKRLFTPVGPVAAVRLLQPKSDGPARAQQAPAGAWSGFAYVDFR